MQIKVLVIEDKVAINQGIVDMLTMEGHIAMGALSIFDAKKYIVKEEPDIVLLDIMLPDGKGYDLIPFIRMNGECRVIVITALSDQKSKEICYKYGGDDYITKPFDIYEIIYKVNAIKKRILNSRTEFNVGDIFFNVETNELKCKEKFIIIQPSQMKFFKNLYNKHLENMYLRKSDLLTGNISEVDDSHRIQTLVSRLRENLKIIGSEIVIETIYGKGYKLSNVKVVGK